MANYVNPNLVKNLHFNSPGVTNRDRFATTNIGYTTAVKYHGKDHYQKKIDDEKELRLKMREIVLGHAFELGFDSKQSCPTNEQALGEGKPMFDHVSLYNTKNQVDNKTLVEK